MNGSGNDDSSRPSDSLDYFERLEGNIMNSQSDGEFETDLPFDATPPKYELVQNGFSLEDAEDLGIRGDRLTIESLGGDIIHFDQEQETSGLLNDSELLNHRDHQYDSGSNCPSEDMFHNDGEPLGEGSSTDLMQRYMEATPRGDTSQADLDYASDGHDNEYFGYSGDAFDHHEHFYNNNDEQYLEGSPQTKTYRGSNTSNGIRTGEERTPLDSEDLSDDASGELGNTIVAANGHPVTSHEENYGDDPPESKDSDSASMSIGQFAPNAVNRNRLPRPVGKPMKRSTPKNNETELHPPNLNESQRGSTGSRSARSSYKNSPRPSATSSRRSRNSSRYSQHSEDLSYQSEGREIHVVDTIPRLDLRMNSTVGSLNESLLSEPSKLELSLRLEAESETRQQADELIDQLQKNYDELLGKYAQAENTIDQLKLGARVNLYGDSPAPGQSIQGTLSPSQKPGVVSFAHPQKAAVHHILSPSSHTPAGHSGGQPTHQTGHSTMGIQTNNNNIQGPEGTRPAETPRMSDSAFPAGEGLLMALAFRVKGHQEQIESFETLLQENQLAPSEQRTVLDRLRADQGKLEADYMRAKEEHNSLRRRNSILGAGADATFDPDQQVEGEIFQLGMKLEDVAEIVQNNLRNNPPTTTLLPPPPHFNQAQELRSREEELRERLQQELENRSQNQRQADERSNFTDGTGDEHDGLDSRPQHEELEPPYDREGSISPNESSEDDPYQSHDEGPSLFSPPQKSRPPQANGMRSRNTNTNNAEIGHRQPKKSQLPRPKSLGSTTQNPSRVRQDPEEEDSQDPREGHPPTRGSHKPPANGFVSPEADSGFMGSESSRQSNQNAGIAGFESRSPLRKPRERQNLRSSKLAIGQRSPPQVHRRLPGDWESPQFSDYDISERDEDVEEDSRRSAGVGKTRATASEKTPPSRSTSQEKRRSVDKPKQRPTRTPSDRHQPSGLRLPAEKHRRDRQIREPQHTLQRDRTPERRGTGVKSGKVPSRPQNGYGERTTVYPNPSSRYSQLPKQSDETRHSRFSNPREAARIEVPERRSGTKGPGEVLRQRPRRAPEEQRGYDTRSDVTQSSGKSEAVKGLQNEIERLKRQMAKMNSPEKIRRRPPVKEEPRHRRSDHRRSRLDSVSSEAGSNRSEILRALQSEIDELRNKVNEQDTSPLMYGSPLSRGSLRDPLGDAYRDSYLPDSSPAKDTLRETLRQKYIPQSVPRDPSFSRTPTRSVLPSSSPHWTPTRNPAPQFESTRLASNPPYIPDTSSYPSPSRRPYNPPSYPAGRSGIPTEPVVAASPVYSTRLEPCPMCSGSGVHTHGEYSYPRDLHRNVGITDPTPHFGRDGPTQIPLGTSQTRGIYSPHSSQGHHMQAGLNTPQNPSAAPVSVPNPNSAYGQQQAVFTPQPGIHLSQPLSSNHQQLPTNQETAKPQQQQQVFTPSQPTFIQPQPVAQPQPAYYTQSQAASSLPHPVLTSQPQTPANNPQTVSNLLLQAPSNASLPGQAQTLSSPAANYLSLVTIPVLTSVPVSTTTPQNTSEKPRMRPSGKQRKKSTESQNADRAPPVEGGTTIYITPTKRRGRYYVLDDKEAEASSTSMEEEYYYRRKPREDTDSKVPAFMRRSKGSKYTRSSGIDLSDAMKMADRLKHSSNMLLDTLRDDVSKSQFY